MSFKALGLSAELVAAVKEQGYDQPTPVQQQVIPAILKGRHIVAAAQTGTGKTAAFTLPLLHRLYLSKDKGTGSKKIRALILTPTRELAAQVADSVRKYSRHMPLRTAVVFGGIAIGPQIVKLRRGVDVLVATPGRLLDLIDQRVVNLSSIEMVVLDEADRMLDMGFIQDIRHILSLLSRDARHLLFSATISREIKALAASMLTDTLFIDVARSESTAQRIEQRIYPVDHRRKRELLSHLIGSENWQQVLVFTRTKRQAEQLADKLEQDGLTATAIHGDKSQGARNRALLDFKMGKKRILVATDVAARGLDINKLPFVVNFELPMVPEDYVHRIGRTGRASHHGLAISLVSSDEGNLLRNIEKFIDLKLPRIIVPGYEQRTPANEAHVSDFRKKRPPFRKTEKRDDRPFVKRKRTRRKKSTP